jgi:hypothetical protein
MSNLINELVRASSSGEGLEVEFELRYLARDPPASAFAYDLLYFDREVRRVAREVRDAVPKRPLETRLRSRPLPINHGLVVGDSHRSEFSFLLNVPQEIYDLILSEPAEFVERLLELTAVYSKVREIILRRRTTGDANEEVREEVVADPAAEEISEVGRIPDKGSSGGALERIQRVRLPGGVEYEIVERVSRAQQSDRLQS